MLIFFKHSPFDKIKIMADVTFLMRY